MSFKKTWMRTKFLPGCFVTKKVIMREPKVDVSKQYSSSRLSLSDISEPGSPFSVDDLSNSLVGTDLHVFTVAELKVITNNFSSSNFLGKGGFGSVHKGFIHDRLKPGLAAQPVAVKRLDLDGTQGHREWLAEVIFLGQLSHPHLLKLIGYCWEEEQRLLVYEYMVRGSLENQLFRRYSVSLSWLTRINIALGAAKGLAFLHGEEKPVIYRDFKASNILLDSDLTAKLSDFGLAKDGPEGDETHVSTRVMGTRGYAAPEYIMTGHLTTMSDVYSFGVVLLELLTGRKVIDEKRPIKEQNLVNWTRPSLKDPKKLCRIMDPRLEGQYSREGSKRAAALAYLCLSCRPKSRPAMSQVVQALENLMGLDDIPIGPFVYVAPNGEHGQKGSHAVKEKKKVDDDQEGKKRGNGENREKNEQPYRQKDGLRHRSSVAYSDTALYNVLQNELNFTSKQKKSPCS